MICSLNDSKNPFQLLPCDMICKYSGRNKVSIIHPETGKKQQSGMCHQGIAVPLAGSHIKMADENRQEVVLAGSLLPAAPS